MSFLLDDSDDEVSQVERDDSAMLQLDRPFDDIDVDDDDVGLWQAEEGNIIRTGRPPRSPAEVLRDVFCRCHRMKVIYASCAVLLGIIFIAAVAVARNKTPPLESLYTEPRLPRTLMPSHYEVTIKPRLDSDRLWQDFSGTVTTTAQCLESTNLIVMHVLDLDIGSVTVENADTGEPVSIRRYGKAESLQYLLVDTAVQLQAGANISVTVSFTGQLRGDNLAGLYVSRYTLGNQTHEILTTQFESTFARKAFPCWDEPGTC